MNTNEFGAPAPAGDPTDGLTGEILRLAQQLFAAGPAPLAAVPLGSPEASAPNAANGPAPPSVGSLPNPGPLPSVLDATNVPSAPNVLNFASAASFSGAPSVEPPLVGGAQPYFLEISGFPSAGSATPARSPVVDAAPSVPTAPTAATSAPGEQSAPATIAPLASQANRGPFDPYAVRRDFPILEQRIHGRPLVWLDNAATTQKPRAVIERLKTFYERENSNIHRAAHTLAGRATDAYEAAREKVRSFLNAPSTRQIVFVRGGTEAINLVAQSYGRRHVGAGDEIVVTALEHHANIVPWQMLAKEKRARLRVVPVDDRGQVLLEDFERLLGPRTRLVAITHVSNALGTIVPVAAMTAIAHRHGARVLLDGAQAVSHLAVDVQALDCDFYCFSGHKVFAPTGIGALYGKADALEAMPPWQGGGNMIADVTFERTSYQGPPARFEAGTGSIADAVGLGAALDYVTAIGMNTIERYEHELLVYATERLLTVPGLALIGTAHEKAGVLSFVLDGQRTEDVGAALDQEGIAVRSGHHCAQPILRRFGLESTVRASLALYNTCEDIDALVAALLRLQAARVTL